MARILLAWELGGGLGHVTRLEPLARELVRQGHDVKLFTSGDSARPLNFAQLLRKRFVNQPVSFARGSTRHFGPRV